MAEIVFNKTSNNVTEIVDNYGNKQYIMKCNLNYPADDIKIEDVSQILGSINAKSLEFVDTQPYCVVGKDVRIANNLKATNLDLLGNVYIGGETDITENLQIDGTTTLLGNTKVGGHAKFKRGLKALKDVIISNTMAFAVKLEVGGKLEANGVTPILDTIEFVSNTDPSCTIK